MSLSPLNAPATRLGRALAHALRDHSERRARIEATVVKRSAGDRTGDHVILGTQQCLDVCEARKTTRSDHRDGDSLRKGSGGLQVEAREHAIAIDVGVDDGGHPGTFEALRQLRDLQFAHPGPSFHGHLATFGIDADGDATGEAATRIMDEGWFAYGDGA